jgi:Ca-activated chloride channel family protein
MRFVVWERARVRAAMALCALAGASGACSKDAATRESPGDPSPVASAVATDDRDKGGQDLKERGGEGYMTHGGAGFGGGVKPPSPNAPPKAATGDGVVALQPLQAPPPPTTITAASAPNPYADVPVLTPPVAPIPKLDPNARYATTYRPGGAALAAFDSAVSRGQIAPAYKDLVGDFGARYAPAVAKPPSGALAVDVDTERTAIGPNGGPMNLRVTLVGSDQTPSRAQLSVHIVLDISGSMSGQAIDDARKAAEAVVDKLDANDDFSMVTFSDDAKLLVSDGAIGPRRAKVKERIEGVKADGGTNISAGLDQGYLEAHSGAIPADAVRIVMLLSDGHANGGDTNPDHLADRAAKAFQDGIQTSSFGLGTDFDASLMSRIADRGAGGYYYLADSSQITPALSREIDARLQPVATAVELRVRLRPDVAALKVFGSRELSAWEAAAVRSQEVAIDKAEQTKHGITADRQTDAEGGMRFFIPAFARGDRHSTMLTVQLPPGATERAIASVEVRFKDRVLGKNVTREVPLKMRWAASDADSAATEDASVQKMAQAFAAGEAILAAAESVDHGDRAGARKLLDERAQVLRQASDALHEPMLAEDAGRLTRLAAAVGGDQQVADPLPLVVMLRGSGYGYL